MVVWGCGASCQGSSHPVSGNPESFVCVQLLWNILRASAAVAKSSHWTSADRQLLIVEICWCLWDCIVILTRRLSKGQPNPTTIVLLAYNQQTTPRSADGRAFCGYVVCVGCSALCIA